MGDYKNSLKYNLLAIATAREVNDTTLQACVINQFIAATYTKMNDYRRAIPYSMEVMRMGKRYNDQSYFNTGCSTLALEYIRTNQFTKAMIVLQDMKSRAVTNLDQLTVIIEFVNDVVIAKRLGEAGRYVQELKGLLPKIPRKNVTELMNAYNALALYYSQLGQVKLAYHYTELYATMAHKLNYTAGIRTAEYRYYKLVSLKGDKKSAMAHFLKEKEIKDVSKAIL